LTGARASSPRYNHRVLGGGTIADERRSARTTLDKQLRAAEREPSAVSVRSAPLLRPPAARRCVVEATEGLQPFGALGSSADHRWPHSGQTNMIVRSIRFSMSATGRVQEGQMRPVVGAMVPTLPVL
jgi:hypothetical protein